MGTDAEKKPAKRHPVTSREDWLGKRIELLKKEKELTRLKDDLSHQIHELAWVRIEKNHNYTQQTFGSTEAPGISVFHKGADGGIFLFTVHIFRNYPPTKP